MREKQSEGAEGDGREKKRTDKFMIRETKKGRE